MLSTIFTVDLKFNDRLPEQKCSSTMCGSMFENLHSRKRLLRGVSESDIQLAASKTSHFSLLQAMCCDDSSGMKRLWVKRFTIIIILSSSAVIIFGFDFLVIKLLPVIV
jgi:hypothetical protein